VWWLPTQTNCTSVCSLCSWSHTFQTTGVDKYRKKSMATCHYNNCLGEAVIFSTAESRCQTVLSVWQSNVHVNCILHTQTHVFTHVALAISVNERLTGQFQFINYSIKKVGRSFSFCCHTRTANWVHLTSYPKCTSGSFPGNKASGVGNKPLTLI